MFQKLDNGLNTLAPSFWNDCVKCYELTTLMRQSDPLFINILNWFKKATYNATDVNTINSLCHKQPPNDSMILHLFYMNKDTIAYNIKVFNNAEGPTYHLEAIDIKRHSLPTKFEIPNDSSKTTRLHTTIKV